MCYTSSTSFARHGRQQAWQALSGSARLVRGWGDCYGHVLVATGRAEAMLDPIMNPWDCGPFPVILEEAGGTFTDWQGETTIHGADAVSTNGPSYEIRRPSSKAPPFRWTVDGAGMSSGFSCTCITQSRAAFRSRAKRPHSHHMRAFDRASHATASLSGGGGSGSGGLVRYGVSPRSDRTMSARTR